MKRIAILMAAAVAAVAVAPGRARADAAPACTPTVGKDAEILVDGKPTGIVASNQPEKNAGAVTTYPFDATHVLLAWTASGHYGRPDGSDLYLVDCTSPAKAKVYAHGDFGHAVALPGGKTLVYSDGEGRGLGLFELATKKTKGLTYPPTFKPDSAECDGREPGLHDILTQLDVDADLLELERGGSCGFEGDWTSTPYFIDHITTKPGKPRRGFPIAQLAAGPDNTLWATATDPCEPAASAVAWSSADLGATWTKHAVPKAATGIGAILTDAKQPELVIVATGTCNRNLPPGPAYTTNRLHVSRDAGATWQVVMLPAKVPDDRVDTVAVASTDGSLEHLAVWGWDGGDDGREKMWTSSDAGAHWASAKKVLPHPAAARAGAKVQLGDATFEPAHDGLVVRRGGKTTRVYPYRTTE